MVRNAIEIGIDVLADNRPVPKPHFAAVPLQPAKPAAAMLPTISTTGANKGVGSRARRSLVPVGMSHRASIVPSANGYQPFALPAATGRYSVVPNERDEGNRSGSANVGLTEKEIDDRVSHSSLGNVVMMLKACDVDLESCGGCGGGGSCKAAC